MIKIIRLLGFICAVVGGSYTGNVSAIPIVFDPYKIVSTAGSTITVDVRLSEYATGSAPSVSAYDLGIIFDSNYLNLEVAGVVFSNELALFEGSLTSVTPGISLGSLTEFRIAEVSLESEDIIDQWQSGDFILLSLSFTGIQTGISPIKLGVYDWLDAASNPSDIHQHELGLEGPNVSIPEPMTFWLISIGMLYFSRKSLVLLVTAFGVTVFKKRNAAVQAVSSRG